MSVSEGYVQRLQDYVAVECASHARRPGDKGVNAYSRYTERVLSEWGLPGFAAGQISRWLRGEVKADLDSSTLQRLGLLRGMSKDPEEAGKLAWAWLNGDSAEPSLPTIKDAQVVAELPAPYLADFGNSAAEVLDRIVTGQYTPGQLREIAIAAVEQLTATAEQQEDTEPGPNKSALSWLLQGWMTEQGATVADLARAIGTTEARAQKIVQGYAMTGPECVAVANLTRLKPETLAEWGLCPSLRVGPGAADHI